MSGRDLQMGAGTMGMGERREERGGESIRLGAIRTANQ